jgi:hypothetical protein
MVVGQGYGRLNPGSWLLVMHFPYPVPILLSQMHSASLLVGSQNSGLNYIQHVFVKLPWLTLPE